MSPTDWHWPLLLLITIAYWALLLPVVTARGRRRLGAVSPDVVNRISDTQIEIGYRINVLPMALAMLGPPITLWIFWLAVRA